VKALNRFFALLPIILTIGTAPSVSAQDKSQRSSGTGIAVSSIGHILTNDHVAGSCDELEVFAGEAAVGTAKVLSRDPRNDFALVRISRSLNAVATFRRSPVRSGEDIVALGFPYRGLLATEANVSVGIVSALAGLRNDTSQLQISAPVQPGNSGGPLLDRSGLVVGVVVSKLDALKVAKIAGDIPQNVNFAIKGELAVAFLRAAGVDARVLDGGKVTSVPDVVEASKRFTLLLECDPGKAERERLAKAEADRAVRAERERTEADARERERRAVAERQEREQQAARAERERELAEVARAQADFDRDFRLSMPVRCQVPAECFIAQYVDHGDARDYACGHKTVLRSAATVFLEAANAATGDRSVIAAADGVITRVVGGLYAQVEIDHGSGWRTTYTSRELDPSVELHARVTRGQRLGQLGKLLSDLGVGTTFWVTKQGKVIDPFRENSGDGCGYSPASRWDTAARDALTYQPISVVKFGASPTEINSTNFRLVQLFQSIPAATRFWVYVSVAGLAPKSDRIVMTLFDPSGTEVSRTSPEISALATGSISAWLRTPLRPFAWQKGQYTLQLLISRVGREDFSSRLTFTLSE
jgi:hypothetical protein